MKKIVLLFVIMISVVSIAKADDAPTLFKDNNTLQYMKDLNDSLELGEGEDAFGQTYNKKKSAKSPVKTSTRKVVTMDFHIDIENNDSVVGFNSSIKTSLYKAEINNKINKAKSVLKRFLN